VQEPPDGPNGCRLHLDASPGLGRAARVQLSGRRHWRTDRRARPQPGAIDFVQVRHEEMAGLMATGHAKFTGEMGVCLATQGPGAIHLFSFRLLVTPLRS
jgi:hypothetical protein